MKDIHENQLSLVDLRTEKNNLYLYPERPKNMVIAVDFDGTCVTHAYPRIGDDIGAIPVLKKLVQNSHKLVLFTMRSGKELAEAQNWLESQGVSLYGVNRNPTQDNWTSSPKAYAEYYIDDAALGCPLLFDFKISHRQYVDWGKMSEILRDKGLL